MSKDEFVHSTEFKLLIDNLINYFKDVDFSDNYEVCLEHELITVGSKEIPSRESKHITIEIEIIKEFRDK
jgi:hypothetical protein